MFEGLKRRVAAIGTIKALCEGAEAHARRDGMREPGAEHFLLAALDMPDSTARLAFEKVEAEPASFEGAVRLQYDDGLRFAGVDPGVAASASQARESLPPSAGLYVAASSGQEIMQALAAERRDHDPLLGAHVVAAVCRLDQGVAARALRAMGIDRAALRQAADAVARTAMARR